MSALCSLTFAWWAWKQYDDHGGVQNLLMSGGSVIAAIGLVVYGRWFLRKLKDVSFI
jgi:hypothetical protein